MAPVPKRCASPPQIKINSSPSNITRGKTGNSPSTACFKKLDTAIFDSEESYTSSNIPSFLKKPTTKTNFTFGGNDAMGEAMRRLNSNIKSRTPQAYAK
jgi:hypothetical protein